MLVLDESLSPQVGQALRLVGYPITLVHEISSFEGVVGVKDEQLIPWMGDHNAVWIHADDEAKRRHGKLLLAYAIRTFWVRRPKRGMNSRQQLRVLSYVMDDFLQRLQTQPRKRHYELSMHGAPVRTRIRLRSFELET